ncbi:MAG: glycosyltransferase family 4 protein, partial [Planctomycetes bacterium]|nr:glycosyltransferase family 4 protein [Planctomycetota bacterium]
MHLKIALVTPGFQPGKFGMVARVVEAHARSLARRGHEVRVVAGGLEPGQTDPWHNEIMAGLDVRRLDLSQGGETPSAAWDEAVGTVDICHIQHTKDLPKDLVRTLSRRLPVVLTQLDFYPECADRFRSEDLVGEECAEARETGDCGPCERGEGQGTGDWEARRQEAQAEIDAARLVLFPSRSHLVRLADHLSLDPALTRILPPGLCQDFDSSVLRPAPWTGHGPLRVLHFGRRSQDRGTLDLVRALAPLAHRGIECILMGPEAEEGIDSEVEALRGDLSIRILGRFDARSLQRIARTCHLAAFPNRHPSGYSLAIDEALAMGLPVLASECGAAMEQFGQGPIQCLPAGDVPAWTQAFRKLLKNPGLQSEAFAT